MRSSLLVLAFVVAIPCSVWAQKTQDQTDKRIEYPSPDGRFAFLFARPPEGRKTVDLIEKDSGKVLRRIVESEEGSGDRLDANMAWTSDSKVFAVGYRLNRRGSEIVVFSRSGEIFHQIKLPKFPRAELPAESGKGEITDVDGTHALRWEKDGSLVAEIETKKTRGDDVLIATRTIVFGFDQSGEARILKTTQSVTTQQE